MIEFHNVYSLKGTIAILLSVKLKFQSSSNSVVISSRFLNAFYIYMKINLN